MNPPQVYMCSPSWTPLPSPSQSHPSGSSQCTSPEHHVSYIKPGLEIHFTYDNVHVSMSLSQIIPPSSSPTKSKRLFYTSVSLLLSHIAVLKGYSYVRMCLYRLCSQRYWWEIWIRYGWNSHFLWGCADNYDLDGVGLEMTEVKVLLGVRQGFFSAHCTVLPSGVWTQADGAEALSVLLELALLCDVATTVRNLGNFWSAV